MLKLYEMKYRYIIFLVMLESKRRIMCCCGNNHSYGSKFCQIFGVNSMCSPTPTFKNWCNGSEPMHSKSQTMAREHRACIH